MIHCIRHFWTSWVLILFLIAVSTYPVTSEVPNEGLNFDGEVLLQREGRRSHYGRTGHRRHGHTGRIGHTGLRRHGLYGHRHHRYRYGGFRRHGLMVPNMCYCNLPFPLVSIYRCTFLFGCIENDIYF
ncbi:unnamed protein product [Allacma fusca]|uniref:Glycine-rich protein n=1 Tax=Allacma fusca TaxID=39272 RepID=A0A8J2JF60_9HEXA|nr:unnamed protein product [Allacma fusca]